MKKCLRGLVPFKILQDTRKVCLLTDDNFFIYYHNYTKICLVSMTQFNFLKIIKLTLLINYNKRYSSMKKKCYFMIHKIT